jgi:hypothetical protein
VTPGEGVRPGYGWWYELAIHVGGRIRHSPLMNTKRIAATILWFVGGWVLGSMALFALGLSTAIAPAVGLLCAAVVYVDPAGRLWAKETVRVATPEPETSIA